MEHLPKVSKRTINPWFTKFPTEEGLYWFYGYRYGKRSCGSACEPELMLLRVMKCANGFLYNAEGQFMYESEVEEAHFQKIDIPEFPRLK